MCICFLLITLLFHKTTPHILIWKENFLGENKQLCVVSEKNGQAYNCKIIFPPFYWSKYFSQTIFVFAIC